MSSQRDSDRPHSPEVAPGQSSAPIVPARSSSFRGMIFFVIGGLLAAFLTTACIHRFYDSFEIPADVLALSGKMQLKPEEELRSAEFMASITRNRAVLAIGAFGTLSGAIFSVVAAAVPGARRSPVVGAVLGLLLGGVFGVLGGVAGSAAKPYLLGVTEDDLLRMIGMHAAFWTVAGVGIGLAVGITFGTKMAIPAAVASAVFGALIAAGVYAPLAAVVFPNENSDLIVPESFLNRLLWTSLAATCMAVLMARSTKVAPVASLPRQA